ncbi:hypothetical protein Taro_052075 [Colocasia esculenta]|uniref:Uncharacterized protein n=1 Tax=Colocasia esculenta TaxID=4460 RepID=A0A843XIA5_COLES|nr:hypothetical protein [Colocasia esculenta]
MLEYSCGEVTVLLQKNLVNARASLEVLVADLQFLRDQVTIIQDKFMVVKSKASYPDKAMVVKHALKEMGTGLIQAITLLLKLSLPS